MNTENSANATTPSPLSPSAVAWMEALRNSGAVFDGEHLSGFGDAGAERSAAVDRAVRSPLEHYGLIRVSGDDARSFLHAQLTSDIQHLNEHSVQHSAWCSAKGRMIASFIVWQENGVFWLAVSRDLADAVVKRLQMFVLRAKVVISIATHRLVGLSSPQPDTLHSFNSFLGKAGLPQPEILHWAAFAQASGDSLHVLRLDDSRAILALPEASAAAVWADLALLAQPVAPLVWQWLDIRAGLPRVTAATREQFVPQMLDFDRIGGVSFHKGCYPGQEIVARTQYLGKVKRHLFRIHADFPLAAGNELFSPAVPDQSCGSVVTASPAPGGGVDALAVLMEAAAADQVHIASPDGPALSSPPQALFRGAD